MVVAWRAKTHLSRAAVTYSGSPDTMDLSADVGEEYIAPFCFTEVPGTDYALATQLEADVAAGMAVGYPEFMCRLEIGIETLHSWLYKVERCVSGQPLLTGSSLGKIFFFSGLKIHGLTLWYVLISLPRLKQSKKLRNMWHRLIGKPVLEFLDREGFKLSQSWVDEGPSLWMERG